MTGNSATGKARKTAQARKTAAAKSQTAPKVTKSKAPRAGEDKAEAIAPKAKRKAAIAKSAAPAPSVAAAAPPPAAASVAPAPPPAASPAPPPAAVADLMRSQTRETLDMLSRNLADAMTRANGVFSRAFHDQSRAATPMRADPFNAQGALTALWGDLAQRPETLRDAHGALWRRYGEIWGRQAQRYMAGGLEDASAPASRDRRFKDPEWRTDPFFALMRETYLATAEWITDLVTQAEGLDAQTRRKAAFFIKQAVDAASPSNFLLTNPTALRATLQSSGENLLKGLENFNEDMKRGGGQLNIKHTDFGAFDLGKNIATTPGKVVFRNHVFELLQYTPTTQTVHETPLLIFPPWINKFYIMDLQPKNSMIKWIVDQGHTVFLVSWVNPDAEMAKMTLEDYMRDGVLAAVEAVQSACGARRMNTIGYCIGGTLLGATLGYMAAQGDDRINSATFLASQTDFAEAGELLVFTDQAGLRYLEERIAAQGGLLDAQAMADTFNSLRSNDLIWNYIVDNYYLGNQPPPFDLLYWNADQTRMPATLHLQYLRLFYQDNAMAEGRLELAGVHIDPKRVKTPIFMQSSKEDHIAPYSSVYRGARLFGGPVEFMMAGSGHIAGVINPPAANKYQHWINHTLPDTVDEWLVDAEERPGSWWPHWNAWLSRQSGAMVPARDPAKGGLPVLGDAPGEYVRVRSF